MKIIIYVMPKASVLDPQGVTIQRTLQGMGLKELEGVRVGKRIELEIATPGDRDAFSQQLHAICQQLLSNPVIEDYTLEIQDDLQAAEPLESAR